MMSHRSMRGGHMLLLKYTKDFQTSYYRKQHFHSKDSRMSHGLSDLLCSWIQRFEKESVPDAKSSAEFIIAHVKGLKTLHNINMSDCVLDKEEMNTIERLCQRRLKRMPVQYILEEWDFGDLSLKMKPPVLIPRPETEELAQHCKKAVEALKMSKECPPIIEIGSGCGAIILTLLHAFKQLRGVAVDISSDACLLTQENAVAIGIDERLKIVEGDINNEYVLSELKDMGPYSLLVSNPPYINTCDIPHLQPEILGYEDVTALDGGQNGLDVIMQILKNSAEIVLPHGHVWLEVGPDHPQVIQRLADSKTFPNLQYIKTVKDMFERERFCHLQVTS